MYQTGWRWKWIFYNQFLTNKGDLFLNIKEAAEADNISLKYNPKIFARLVISIGFEMNKLIMIDMDDNVDRTFNAALDLIINSFLSA